MTAQIIPVEPFDCVVFGGTGDLAERKLIPALYHRQLAGQLSDPTRIIGASRSPMSHAKYRDFARAALNEFVKESERDEAEINRFIARLHYVAVDAKAETGWDKLATMFEDEASKTRVRAFYLAVAPALFGDIADKLKKCGLITKNSRIIVEKPIGRDLESAKALNDTIGNDFAEQQIFRIDHYLGKETVQNLMALRFANALYEPLWNSTYVDHVQITVAESVGLEGPRRLLQHGRRAARHGAEPFAPAAVSGGHGSAAVDGCGFGARRETESAALAQADHREKLRGHDGARPVQGGRVDDGRGQVLCRGIGLPVQH